MTQINPTNKYVFTFMKDENGQDVQYRFMLTLSKRIKDVQAQLMQALGTLDGIDGINPGVGAYTIELVIARSFDAGEIIAELKKRLEQDVLSEIARPSLTLVT